VQPLEGPRLKLNRAREHFHAISQEFEAWGRGHIYGTVGEFDAETSYYVFKVRVLERPPERWGVMIGDLAHNARSALDHIAWQLVLLNNAEPTRRTQFPIFKSPEDYEARAEPMLAGMHERNQATVAALQPYTRGDHPEWDPLWVLAD
jgi:hypothetical protein